MSPRVRMGLGFVVSLALLLGALLMPTGWYDALPRPTGKVPPVRGTTLLRVVMAVQGLAVAILAVRGWRWVPLPDSVRSLQFAPREEVDDISEAQAWRWLGLITLLALALRVWGISAELWTDEVLTVREFVPLPFTEILSSYRTSNNHLLISLLVKASVMLFGEHEWSVRLTSVICGVLSVPALYRVARLAMSRQASLGAALLLAVSYHHVFFSQNARGYVVHVFFALLATRALLDGLREDRVTSWVQYGIATLLGVMSLLNMAFVIAAQLLVVTAVVVQVWRRGASVRPLLWRLTTVFAVTGMCCFSVYAIALPDAYFFITVAYTQPTTGSSITSYDLVADVIRGVTDGFGRGVWLAAVPFMALAAGGLFVLWRRQWAVAALLLLPGVLTAALLGYRGMTFSPRYFLLWLPLAVLTAVVTVEAATQQLRAFTPRRRQGASVTLIVMLAALSALSLIRYYAVPKQPFVATIRYVERVRRPDDLILAIQPSAIGVRYYAERLHLPIADDYLSIKTRVVMDSVLARRAGRRVVLITSLEHVLAKAHPELRALVNAGWQRDTTFAGTIGGGELSVWSERGNPPSRVP